MSNRSAITQENFERLLTWLAPDREEAGKKYEHIRLSLIQIFTWRGVTEAEDLADETINRVTHKIHEISENYEGDPSRYFYAVANRLIHEHFRKQRPQVPFRASLIQSLEEPETVEQEYECLNACLDELPAESRSLILSYYRKEKQPKIEHRRKLAESLGIHANALRVRAARIRLALADCIKHCVERLRE